MEYVLSVDEHLPMNDCKGQVVKKHEQIAIEEAYKCNEWVKIYLVGDPLGHLIWQVEWFNEALVQVVMWKVEVQGAGRAA